MMPKFRYSAILLATVTSAGLWAQAPAPAARPQGPQGPVVTSPEVSAERKITFRLLAPQAKAVTLRAGDIPGLPREGVQFAKGDNGVWEATVGPIDPGAYRYTFGVDGVSVVDPRNPAVSESNTNVSSLVLVPGSDLFDTRQVPHGAVASVTYYSTALGRHRRMHVYTPPGYELGSKKYPVFYLLHGAGDCDEAWTSVGRAGIIIDNLLATGKVKPMIIVMPAGHTSTRMMMGGGGSTPPRDEFGEDFVKDVMPYVDKHYRVLPKRSDRAIAGLSMGGMQTMNIAMSHLDKFAYVGVFSSGVFSMRPPAPGAPRTTPGPPPEWEKEHAAMLDNAALKRGLKVLWFGTGKDDFLMPTTKATIEMLKKHGFDPKFEESAGGHTWINWRNYLGEFAPMLFR
jgi:enterochelin esterase-like enzyme